jgi:hypothetical protein
MAAAPSRISGGNSIFCRTTHRSRVQRFRKPELRKSSLASQRQVNRRNFRLACEPCVPSAVNVSGANLRQPHKPHKIALRPVGLDGPKSAPNAIRGTWGCECLFLESPREFRVCVFQVCERLREPAIARLECEFREHELLWEVSAPVFLESLF